MSTPENPEVVAVQVVLRQAARNGDYRFIVTFLDRREGYSKVCSSLVCCLERAICTLLADECQDKPGESSEAPRRRAAAIVEAGALELAAGTAVNNAGCCYAATSAACRLITVLTALPVVSAATLRQCRRVDVLGAMLRVLTQDASNAVNVENSLSPLVLCWAYRGLMGAAGAPYSGKPHTQAAAAAAAAVPAGLNKEVLQAALGVFNLPEALMTHVLTAAVMLELQCEVNSKMGKALCQLLRAAGCVFRWMLTGTLRFGEGGPPTAYSRALGTLRGVSAAMENQPGYGVLQRWGITYALQPIMFIARLRSSRMATFNFGFCCGRCCIDMRADLQRVGIPEMLRVISALPLATNAARAHACCVRPAARLMAWAATGCPEVQRELIKAGADEVLRAIGGINQADVIDFQAAIGVTGNLGPSGIVQIEHCSSERGCPRQAKPHVAVVGGVRSDDANGLLLLGIRSTCIGK